jgi:hypothetical protein
MNYYNYNCYTRTLPNGSTECYNKNYFNKDFTRKIDDDEELEDILEKIQLLIEIDECLKN